MARKRKAPTSQQPQEQKPKIVPEVQEEQTSEEEEDEEEQDPEQESSSEESESESDSEEEEDSSSSDAEPDDEASKRETLRELLEPFEKPQIIDLLKQAASEDSTLLTKILQTADSDPVNRKIFIHGLGWDTTSDQLLQAFKPFGEIEESKLVTDKNTGRAKGYAFVVFKTRASAKKALKESQKMIGSRVVSCQLAALGHTVGPLVEGASRKVYVGNVGPSVSPERLKAFFRMFGEIEDGPIGLDPVSGKFKGFAVITYKSAEGFKKALDEPIKVFEGCQLHCKKFNENPNKEKNVIGQNSGGGMNAGVTDVGYGNLGSNNGGILGASSFNPAGLLMAQNQALGLSGNPMFAAGYNPAGMAYSGLSAPIGGISGNYGMNSMAPSGVMGNYGSQAALQGLGPFQNFQTGHSSVGTVATSTTATRAPASGVSSAMTYPSYSSR